MQVEAVIHVAVVPRPVQDRVLVAQDRRARHEDGRRGLQEEVPRLEPVLVDAGAGQAARRERDGVDGSGLVVARRADPQVEGHEEGGARDVDAAVQDVDHGGPWPWGVVVGVLVEDAVGVGVRLQARVGIDAVHRVPRLPRPVEDGWGVPHGDARQNDVSHLTQRRQHCPESGPSGRAGTRIKNAVPAHGQRERPCT